ncbi:uncharacterized protein Bfra_005750 [Botrytis fragariae]|uniref:Uncharacterized protein n=1 Tax=Botrytis fragariae TaxID=1964551 RepID=A0A8H6ARR6_9HELO|nr:uncharacterized protein Bfra_005750 [Botrytis fragariae]KAF5872391.1 hypothetical protein Bfra_005750 [Botrytis fragariae]
MLIHNNVGTRQWKGKKFRRGTRGYKRSSKLRSKICPFIWWRGASGNHLRILVYVFYRLFSLVKVDVGTRRNRSRKGLRLKYDPEYLNGFSVSFLKNSGEAHKVAVVRYINDTNLNMSLSIFRFQPCLTRVEDSNVAKGPDTSTGTTDLRYDMISTVSIYRCYLVVAAQNQHYILLWMTEKTRAVSYCFSIKCSWRDCSVFCILVVIYSECSVDDARWYYGIHTPNGHLPYAISTQEFIVPVALC